MKTSKGSGFYQFGSRKLLLFIPRRAMLQCQRLGYTREGGSLGPGLSESLNFVEFLVTCYESIR